MSFFKRNKEEIFSDYLRSKGLLPELPKIEIKLPELKLEPPKLNLENQMINEIKKMLSLGDAWKIARIDTEDRRGYLMQLQSTTFISDDKIKDEIKNSPTNEAILEIFREAYREIIREIIRTM